MPRPEEKGLSGTFPTIALSVQSVLTESLDNKGRASLSWAWFPLRYSGLREDWGKRDIHLDAFTPVVHSLTPCHLSCCHVLIALLLYFLTLAVHIYRCA